LLTCNNNNKNSNNNLSIYLANNNNEQGLKYNIAIANWHLDLNCFGLDWIGPSWLHPVVKETTTAQMTRDKADATQSTQT